MSGAGGGEHEDEATPPAPTVLPDGTVTFLLADVVGSTELWEQSPRAMRSAMLLHDQLIDAAVEAHSGIVVRPRGEGDSRFAVFRRASNAVAAATEIVERLESATWDTPVPIEVRVGVHTGEADLRDGDYYGTAVNLCARIRGLAAPNQVFVSEATARLLMRSDSGAELHEVGDFQLKGLSLPERVFSLGPLPPTGGPSAEPDPSPVTSAPSPTKRNTRTRWIAASVAAIVVIAVTTGLVLGSTNSSPTTSPPAMPRGYTPTLTKTTCSKQIRAELSTATCDSLTVPQEHAHPDGLKVHLSVVVAPPLPGVAPGAAPTIDIGDTDSLVNSPARARSELIQIVPRGFAGSIPTLRCSEVETATVAALLRPTDDPVSNADEVSAYAACYKRLTGSGIDPGAYTYDTMADDVVDLMAVLRIPRADLVANDFFSHIAFGVLAKVPDSVRTLTLDNPEPAGQGSLTDPVAYLANGFGQYVGQCQADAHCAGQFPDLEATYQHLVATYSATPVLTETSSFTPNVPIRIDGGQVAAALQAALSDDTYFPELATGLSQNPTGLIADLAASIDTEQFQEFAWGISQSLTCSYDLSTLNQAAALSNQQLAPFAGVAIDQAVQQKICAVWKTPTLPSSYFVGVASLVPTLIVEGSLQPYGDTTWAATIQQSLTHSTVGTFGSLGERVLETAPPCLATLRKQFLADPSASLAMKACEVQSPPIQFVDTP